MSYIENAASPREKMHSFTPGDAPSDRRRVPGARCHSNSGGGRSCSRTVFTGAQLEAMEDRFVRQSFLTREERIELAEAIQLTERQILIWFQNRRGRLKRKGPADKAYERKQYCDGVMGSDAKGRAFLSGITWAKQRRGAAASSDKCVKSTRNAHSAGGFVQPLGDSVFTTWNNSLEEESGEVRKVPVESHTAGRMCRSTDVIVDHGASERMSVGVQQTHRSAVDRHRSYLPVRSTIHEQSFYHQQSFQNSGDTTGIWERGRTPWNDMNQQHRMEQLFICRSDVAEVNRGCHPTPTSLWTHNRPVIQSNYEPLSDLTYPCLSVPFNDTGESLPSSMDCWSGSEMMTSDWFNTNPCSVGFGSVDRCQPHSYHQPIDYDACHLQSRRQMD